MSFPRLTSAGFALTGKREEASRFYFLPSCSVQGRLQKSVLFYEVYYYEGCRAGDNECCTVFHEVAPVTIGTAVFGTTLEGTATTMTPGIVFLYLMAP